MKKRGLQPEVVQLPHDTEGYWVGNKNAKNVVVFYHGMYNYGRTELLASCNIKPLTRFFSRTPNL